MANTDKIAKLQELLQKTSNPTLRQKLEATLKLLQKNEVKTQKVARNEESDTNVCDIISIINTVLGEGEGCSGCVTKGTDCGKNKYLQGFDDNGYTICKNINWKRGAEPVFTSPTTFSVDEGTTTPFAKLYAIDADDGEIEHFSIKDPRAHPEYGADAAAFSLSTELEEGVNRSKLKFKFAPDWYNPTDVGDDNTYSVTVQASDGTNTTNQTITVFVQRNADPVFT